MTETLRQRLLPMLLGGLVLGLSMNAPAKAEELRIGFIAPMTGIFAQIGKDMVNGFQMYLDEHNNKLGGADVKFIVEDNQGKADAAVTKAKKLVLSDKVDMFVGGLLASTGYALAPVSTSEKTLYISSIPAADDLTQRQAANIPTSSAPAFPRRSRHNRLVNGPVSKATKRSLPSPPTMPSATKSVGGFQKVFEDCGGKIIQKIWPPIGTKDFGPYIPAIKGDADAVFTLMVGPMSLQFPKQLRRSGYKKPIMGGGTSYDEFALPFMGDEVIGDVSALQYSAALETPKNEAFVKGYRANTARCLPIIRKPTTPPRRSSTRR